MDAFSSILFWFVVALSAFGVGLSVYANWKLIRSDGAKKPRKTDNSKDASYVGHVQMKEADAEEYQEAEVERAVEPIPKVELDQAELAWHRPIDEERDIIAEQYGIMGEEYDSAIAILNYSRSKGDNVYLTQDFDCGYRSKWELSRSLETEMNETGDLFYMQYYPRDLDNEHLA